jgi:DNA-directed RNA polymerase specialized sigma24 family protein
MLVEEAPTREMLRQVVAGFTRDPQLLQDLMQECLLHLWKLETRKPGRTRSWYLQGCRFHLQHCLVLGRSLDSLKRSGSANRIVIDGDDEEPALHGHHTNGEVFDAVSFGDVVATLKREMKPRERQVLSGLADGMVLQEIASEFGMSYPTVLKYRRKLAALTARLGIAQPLCPLKQNGDTTSKCDALMKRAAARGRRRRSLLKSDRVTSSEVAA